MSRHPISCILPPYMLDQIAQNGTPEQRQKAELTATLTAQFRASRLEMAARPSAVPRAPGVAMRQRSVYTANFGSSLPGQLVRAEGAPPSGDAAVDEAYDGSGATYDLYWDVYQRNSIDGSGMRLDSTVHYQQGYDNAFWNGQQMVYGDGDEDLPPAQRLFNRFTISIDVIGHELTHGVTQHTGNLVYSNQPGALNESFSDVFGTLVKQRTLGQTVDQADWLIGAGLFTANVQGVALRSMKEPGTAYNDPVLGKDPQPGHMSGYVNTTSDNGGVHINSGIPNRAFYLTATEIGGFAWEKAGRIWYVTLRDRIRSTTNFQQAADLTYAVAGELFGVNSLEQMAVKNGWAGVGITVGSSSDGDTPQGCLQSVLKAFGIR
jgi:Zn-dependent metalloprotease